ncbi:MAG TPA: hypothetical protein VN894_15075 [Polyangiaceae bacterium]|nr:hypothetical protein [Polyangiaceae bacterium]
MKAFAAATIFLVLGALAGVLAVGCADQLRPANSAQNQAAAESSAGAAPTVGAASKDGGGGW